MGMFQQCWMTPEGTYPLRFTQTSPALFDAMERGARMFHEARHGAGKIPVQILLENIWRLRGNLKKKHGPMVILDHDHHMPSPKYAQRDSWNPPERFVMRESDQNGEIFAKGFGHTSSEDP